MTFPMAQRLCCRSGGCRQTGTAALKIFFINLDQREDRRDFLEGELRSLGLEAERIRAVPKDEVPEDLIERQKHDDPLHSLTPTEIACVLSHLKTWRRMLELDLPYALVLEDDAYLSKRLPQFLAEVPGVLHKTDIVRMETRNDRVKVGPLVARVAGVELRRPHSIQWGMAGYIITTACARRLLRDDRLFDEPIDVVLFDPAGSLFYDVRTLQASPGLCIQGDVLEAPEARPIWQSDIAAERRQRLIVVRGPPLNKRRKIKRETIRLWRQIVDALRAFGDHVFRRIRWRQIPYDSGKNE